MGVCQVGKPSMMEVAKSKRKGALWGVCAYMTSRILRQPCEVSSSMIRSCRRMLAPPSQLFFAPAAIPALHGSHEKVPFHSSAVREE